MKNKLMLNCIQQKSKNTEKISLPKCLSCVASVGDNGVLSQNSKAVKPNRQTMAFLLSVILTNNSQRYSLNPSLFGRVSVYNGLIRPNTIPFLGNKSSRLVTVVESRCPICGNKTLTKLLGGYHA